MASSIYFPASEEPDGKRKVLRLRLDSEPVTVSGPLMQRSSSELKAALGMSYSELAATAKSERRSINSQAILLLSASLQETSNQAPLIAELSGTYRGGKGDFFHDLFPFLEAFSPNFVRELTTIYSPEARALLDPFGGCGTSPLTFAYESNVERKAYFCEINPLMQRIIALKEWLRGLPINTRVKLNDRIERLASELSQVLSTVEPNDFLQDSYRTVFGKSDMFPESTYDQVLRIKSAITKFATDDFHLANVLELATLASLVPASNMQRAGDLRRKRPEERRRISDDLLSHVAEALTKLSAGLMSYDTHTPRTLLLAEDARNLSQIPSVNADLLITSPPYLNGTNYFRNTKLELWFLGVLRSSRDLAHLRDAAITAGINDVRGARGKTLPPSDLPSCLVDCVEQLDEVAYDRRIPQMVRWYAHDLEIALQASLSHVKSGAPVAIDIGDSIYSGVKVPTDSLVAEVLERNDCSIQEIVPIRQRMARGGQKVHQVCVVAIKSRKRASRSARERLPRPDLAAWKQFESQLPHKSEPFCKRNWGHPWHSLCSFQGKLKPAIAKFLVDALVPSAGTVLDPFVGVGTIPFEAALSGRKSFGFDLSPAAVAISSAKVSTPSLDEISSRVSDLSRFIDERRSDRLPEEWLPAFNKPLADYYHPDTLQEIRLAREWFALQHPWNESDCLLLACSMHVLHGNRPYALSRRSHPVTPYAPSGDFVYKPLVEKLNEKLQRTLEQTLPDAFCEGGIFEMDATSWWPSEIDQLDAVITSPPFFDSTRFFSANWIRLWFSGWNEYEFRSGRKRFLESRQKASFDCYDPIFRQSRERLKSGGLLLLHLGKSNKCDMGAELSKKCKKWFRSVEVFDESVADCESHGIRDKGTVTDHQYLIAY